MVRDLIKSVKPIAGNANFVFTTTGATPINGWGKVKKRLDAALKPAQPWRLHDLRRTAASGMQRLGVRSEVIERALNHLSGSFRGVAGIYQRDPMTADVQAALERWAGHLERITSGGPTETLADDSFEFSGLSIETLKNKMRLEQRKHVLKDRKSD
jgi:hypothetical protein